LFAGEQYDPAIGLYYNRARYFNAMTGRFWTADITDGSDDDPLSLHKYLYGEDDAVDHTDTSGNEIDEVTGALGAMGTIDAISLPNFTTLLNTVFGLKVPSAQITQNIVTGGRAGFFKDFAVTFTVDPASISRYLVVQWIKGSFTLNGEPTPALHQGSTEPANYGNWAIDSASFVAKCPGDPSASTLLKLPGLGKIVLIGRPGHSGPVYRGDAYRARLDFEDNVYDTLNVANTVSAFRTPDDPKPLLSVDWNFYGSYNVP
jgi:RHS repeat-associated protein